MKPTFITTRNQKRFPLIECNYQSATLISYHGRCAKPAAPSFRNISRQYFQNEARHDFVVEGIFFALLIVTATVPLVSAVSAVIQLCRAFGAL
jgi:hypothetical protein